MSTKMTNTDWANALEVFRASLPRRGAKGRDDRKRCAGQPSNSRVISKNTCRLKGPDEFSTFTIAIPDAAIDDLYIRLRDRVHNLSHARLADWISPSRLRHRHLSSRCLSDLNFLRRL